MPTDTQRAPTLAQCIEREREAARQYRSLNTQHNGVALDAARAATDEAVRAVEENVRQGKRFAVAAARYLSAEQILECAQAAGVPLKVLTTPAPTAQGESTGGEHA